MSLTGFPQSFEKSIEKENESEEIVSKDSLQKLSLFKLRKFREAADIADKIPMTKLIQKERYLLFLLQMTLC